MTPDPFGKEEVWVMMCLAPCRRLLPDKEQNKLRISTTGGRVRAMLATLVKVSSFPLGLDGMTVLASRTTVQTEI